MLARLQVYRSQIADVRVGENLLEFRESSHRRHWERFGHLRQILHGKDSALPVREFADVIARPALFQSLEESRGESLLHRGQQTAPAFGYDDGGAVHGQSAAQALQRGLHVGHQVVGEKQAPWVHSQSR